MELPTVILIVMFLFVYEILHQVKVHQVLALQAVVLAAHQNQVLLYQAQVLIVQVVVVNLVLPQVKVLRVLKVHLHLLFQAVQYQVQALQ